MMQESERCIMHCILQSADQNPDDPDTAVTLLNCGTTYLSQRITGRQRHSISAPPPFWDAISSSVRGRLGGLPETWLSVRRPGGKRKPNRTEFPAPKRVQTVKRSGSPHRPQLELWPQ